MASDERRVEAHAVNDMRGQTFPFGGLLADIEKNRLDLATCSLSR